MVWSRPSFYEFGCCFFSYGGGNFRAARRLYLQRFWGPINVVPRLTVAFLMAVWSGIVLHPTSLAVAFPVLVVAISEWSGVRGSSLFLVGLSCLGIVLSLKNSAMASSVLVLAILVQSGISCDGVFRD